MDVGKNRSRTMVEEPRGSADDATGYSPRDLEHFARLSGSSSFRDATSAATRDAGPSPTASGACDYSDNDTRVFARLMEDLDRVRSVKGAASRSGAAASSGGYTGTDNQRFSDLMASNWLGKAGGSFAAEPAGTSFDSQDATSYSASDIEVFRRIMPGTADAPASGADDAAWHPARADREAGSIRIVDFGKEQARSKQRKRPGNPTMKVRYFD